MHEMQLDNDPDINISAEQKVPLGQCPAWTQYPAWVLRFGTPLGYYSEPTYQTAICHAMHTIDILSLNIPQN
jgi:hypothetical protein